MTASENDAAGPEAQDGGAAGQESLRLDPTAVVAQCRAGVASRDVVMALVAELMQAGEAVPLEVERCALEFYIAEDASRVDLKRRLLSVYRELDRQPPDGLEQMVRDSFITEERETDYQEMMADYGRSVGQQDMEPAFLEDLAKVRRFTMTSVERLYALWDAVRYVARSGLEGDLVEAGVWRGGSMMTAALSLQRSGDMTRTLWLFDTFSGLPAPDEELDVDILGNRAIDGWRPRAESAESSLWAYADEADVRANMATTGYPEGRLRFVKGMVEETVPKEAPERIALLRIDTDWYASYKHLLEHLYDRVTPGGLVIFDDYGQFLGARQAVDEFREARGLSAPMFRVDFSCRIMPKF